MKWASAVSLEPDAGAAAVACIAQIRESLGAAAPDLLILFLNPSYLPESAGLPALLMRELGARRLIGCTGGGVVGDGREVERRPALSLTAAVLPGVALDIAHLRQSDLPDEIDPEPIAALFDVGPNPCFLTLPDPFTIDGERLIRAMDLAFPTRPISGGLASGAAMPGGNALFTDEAVHREGAAILAMGGDIRMDTAVAQGCRPIGQPMFITRCRDNVLQELNGQPAHEAAHDLFTALDPADQALFNQALFLGLEMTLKEEAYGQGDFLVRHVMGGEPGTGFLHIGARLQETAVAQFHVRDADASREDLARQLDRASAATGGAFPAGALMFSCLGRGEGLYGVPNHDADLFRDTFGPIPLGGFFCNGELGPVKGQTYLHAYTASFAMFHPRA